MGGEGGTRTERKRNDGVNGRGMREWRWDREGMGKGKRERELTFSLCTVPHWWNND